MRIVVPNEATPIAGRMANKAKRKMAANPGTLFFMTVEACDLGIDVHLVRTKIVREAPRFDRDGSILAKHIQLPAKSPPAGSDVASIGSAWVLAARIQERHGAASPGSQRPSSR